MAPLASELWGSNGREDVMSGQSKVTRKGLSGALARGQSGRLGLRNGQRDNMLEELPVGPDNSVTDKSSLALGCCPKLTPAMTPPCFPAGSLPVLLESWKIFQSWGHR